MGTSLSGLTPATTFDGLLKVGDNDPLTATLKPISTGDGTDTILQLSNSALSIGGTVDINFAGQTNVPMQFYGAGAQLHYISGGNNLNIEYVTTAITENVRLAYAVSNRDVSIGQSSSMGAKLGIKGSGATSATTSLLVQNSAGTDMLKVADNGLVNIIGTDNDYNTVNFQIERSTGESIFRARNRGALEIGSGIDWISLNSSSNGVRLNVSNSEIARIAASGVGIGETTPTARLHVKGSGNTNTTTSLLVQNSDATELLKVTDDGSLDVSGTLTIQRSAANFAMRLGNEQRINGFIDASQTNVLYLASAGGGGNNVFITPTGIGVNQGTPTARLQVKGSGATSATTALLVQNSAGTEHLKITDDGVINARQSLFVNHATNSARALRLGWGSVYGTDNSSELIIGAVYSQNTSPKITLGGKTRTGGADAVLVQTLNGMYIATTANTEDPNAQLHIKGSGSTSATTALIVQNSAGTEHFKTTDDGVTTITSASQSVPLYVNASGNSTAGIELRSINARRFRILATSSISTLEATNTGGISTNSSLNVGSGYTAADSSAVLQADSTTKGFLPPRMTTTQRDAISTPAAGLMIYNTTTNKAQCYNGTIWSDLF